MSDVQGNRAFWIPGIWPHNELPKHVPRMQGFGRLQELSRNRAAVAAFLTVASSEKTQRRGEEWAFSSIVKKRGRRSSKGASGNKKRNDWFGSLRRVLRLLPQFLPNL